MTSNSSLSVRRRGTFAETAKLCAFFVIFAVAPCLWVCSPAAADATSSIWSTNPKSAARLLASGGLEGGFYHAGIEIRLNPGTLTYWRLPGDGGVPPVFSFSGSSNLAGAKVSFPAPTRYIEAGVQSFGYRDDVVFPLDVTPQDPQRPVEITLDLHYATCDQICLPAEAKVDLTLEPRQKPGPETALIDIARAQVPKVLAAKDASGFSVNRVAGATLPTWLVHFWPSPSNAADLFAEGPNDYYFDTVRADGFKLILAQKGAEVQGPIPVTLTLVDGRAAYQSTISLDVVSPTP